MKKVYFFSLFIFILFAPLFTVSADIQFGPYVQFVSPSRAVLKWQTAQPSEGVVTLKQNDGLNTKTLTSSTNKLHQVMLNDLEPYQVYSYQIQVKQGDELYLTEEFALEQKMNYSVPELQGELHSIGVKQANLSAADDILFDSGIHKGYAVIYGSEYYPFAFDLAKQSELMVILIETDLDKAQTAREILSQAGAYGSRINVRIVDDYAQLPITPNFANLILVPNELQAESFKTLLYILRPDGGTAYLQSLPDMLKAHINTELYHTQSVTINGQEMVKITKHELPGIGNWTHQYSNPANNANGGETLTGASKTTDLSVQWVGKPGADFGIDRNPRMPAPIAVSGRLFHQGMNRMVALDAYNGAILWSLEIPNLRRVNLPHDCSNWCADADFLYTAIKHQSWKINQKDGSVSTYFEMPESVNQGGHDWGYIANVGDTVFGSAVKKGTIYTEFFGQETWYDQQQGEGANKVCGVEFFALDHNDGSVKWQYKDGAIIHSTITIADGNVFFVESRNREIMDLDVMRVSDDLLWSGQYLVALDAETGNKVWEKSIDTVDGKAVFFMIHGDGKLVIASSADGLYHLYGFDSKNGELLWEQSHKWTGDNHSGHMQHPLIVAGRVYLEPNGYDVATGKLMTENMGRREGCSTYSAVANALIYRGEDRRIAMWDRHSEEVTSWVNLRPSCWLSVIPANGMVLAPEGGGGCSCGDWIETSLSFMPMAWQQN